MLISLTCSLAVARLFLLGIWDPRVSSVELDLMKGHTDGQTSDRWWCCTSLSALAPLEHVILLFLYSYLSTDYLRHLNFLRWTERVRTWGGRRLTEKL